MHIQKLILNLFKMVLYIHISVMSYFFASGLRPFHLVLPWGTMLEEWPRQCHPREVGVGTEADLSRLCEQPGFQPLSPSVRPLPHV